MVDRVGLAELAEQKMKKKLPRIAKAKARDIYNGLKLVSEYMVSNDSSDYSEQLKRISKNMSDGVLTKKNLRDAFMRHYQNQEQPSTEGGYSLDFLLGFSDDMTVTETRPYC
ncbi:hypothetical protein M0R45_009748 [Rubus argutus]|uniref:Uncharacterized protein n=1 Tax=Rubus argutus TaxID=59490 RepID=A0AAW1Y6U6_RUBAR